MQVKLLSEIKAWLASQKAKQTASRSQPPNTAATGTSITKAAMLSAVSSSVPELQLIRGGSYFAVLVQLADKCKPEITKQLKVPIPLSLENKLTLDTLAYKSLVADLMDFVKANKYRLVIEGKSQHEIKVEDIEAVLGSLSIVKQEEAAGLGAMLLAKAS